MTIVYFHSKKGRRICAASEYDYISDLIEQRRWTVYSCTPSFEK